MAGCQTEPYGPRSVLTRNATSSAVPVTAWIQKIQTRGTTEQKLLSMATIAKKGLTVFNVTIFSSSDTIVFCKNFLSFELADKELSDRGLRYQGLVGEVVKYHKPVGNDGTPGARAEVRTVNRRA